jgi:asparagine synthase (glutamine-hydrolysing)
MCGICGQVNFTSTEVERADLLRMCEALVRRGPDGQGVHVAGQAGLAQRRLSVIDLRAEGVAPLSNEDGTVWVTFNGEIYNFRELRTDLEARGHRFRTNTDTEVIVHLYEEHGTGCVSRLHGMFAFAIWDGPRRRLLAARDRLGKKPFLYTETSSTLVFASSIASLRLNPAVGMEPDYRALDDFLTYQYVPSPQTAFKNIRKLQPAHYLLWEHGRGVSVERYWSPPLPRRGSSRQDPRDLESEIIQRLSEAVERRLVSDVPLGAFLSGGVDSSAVVGLMTRASRGPVRTFSIRFDEPEFDESRHARAIAERFATEHHEFTVKPNAVAVLPQLVREYGEPFGDSSALPTFYLSQLTRQHVTVALSGDGGDETFAGYDNYGVVSAWNRADRLPLGVRRGFDSTIGTLVRQAPATRTARRLARGSRMLAAPVPERFRLQSSIMKAEEKEAAYSARFRQLLDAHPPANEGPAMAAIPDDVDPVDWMMWHDLQYYLPDCLMVKVDVASMAHGLEVRSPFLDHQFVEFAATIPARLKRDAEGGKRILKRALDGLLPGEILHRPKKGFGVPLRRWFGTELVELLRATVLDERAARRGLIDQRYISRMVDDLTAGRHDWSARLWALLWLELWFREFID